MSAFIAPPHAVASPLAPHEQGRAEFYALSAALLLAPPDARLLNAIADATPMSEAPDAGPIEQAWNQLVMSAAAMDAQAVDDEYAALFVAVGAPQVDPYASRFLTGFLMDAPLAALRADLRALGIVRRRDAAVAEDHLGALCEVMRALVGGAPRLAPQPLRRQRQFFERHIAPWHHACLAAIRNAAGANFYRRVADFVEAFLDVEAEAFAIDDDAPGASAPRHTELSTGALA